ncbi:MULTISPECIES: DMT family transporter [Brevibacillus]|jgi:drug/metabolite transporter (DMT)-like permease|uniref:DMT family transporter n=1 Tax=Brevibacillus TaxID=55080 RepID=UPI0004696B85|nr:DMT family transporter [Brevibacillus borstelensis]KKX56275.1 membrane protein [Brevibacillus borstelensis cifa_chp40]MBE5395518.1 DMT family transporter [Brevibacillus borstelensis]MCC0564553.1 DMT family transporter [Brevibacillus borstelensis]MCM3470465.1 DMT family transporter [Brevibacillus borstelensis]MCM3592040.1 DMT family transporter [Brevibacillus borstelensis]
MNAMWKQQLFGALCLTLAAAIWGGVYVVSKVVLEEIPPFTLLIIRFAIASVVLGVFVVARREFIAKQDFPMIMAIAFVGVTISIGAQFLGTKLSTAHMGALITAASPAFIALFAVWLLKERIHKLQLAGILLATIGVLIVIGIPDEADAQSSLLGNLILLVAAVSWGLYTVMSKKATLRYSSLAVTTYVALFGLIFTCPVMVWELSVTAVSWDFSWKIWAGVLYIGIISTAGAFYLWNKGFELLQAGSGAGFFFVQPIVGAALGWLLLGEHLGIGFFAGAIFIFLGVALSNLQQSAAKQKAGTPD